MSWPTERIYRFRRRPAAKTTVQGLDLGKLPIRFLSSCIARRAGLDANPGALSRAQSCPQHRRNCGHALAARGAMGTGLDGAPFRLLVALAAAGSAGRG